MLIAILAATTNYAAASPASTVAGALGATAVKNAAKQQAAHCRTFPATTMKSGTVYGPTVICANQ
jgi:hypothetical protein